MSKNYQKHRKNMRQIGFVGSQNVKIQKHTAEYTAGTTFSKRMHVKLVTLTHTGFFLYLSSK